MKLYNHAVFNLGVSLVAGLQVPEIVLIIFGGMIPDVVDSILAGRDQRLFYAIHRTFSHYPWPYLVFYFASYNFEVGQLVAFGALLHVLMDFLTPMGIPLVSPTKRVSLAKIKTGSMFDYILTYCPLLGFLCNLYFTSGNPLFP